VPSSAASEHDAKVRFFHRAWSFTIAFTTPLAVLFTVEGLSGQAVLNAFIAVLGVGLLAALRAGVPVNRLSHLSLAVPQVAVAAGALVQTPFDLSSVFFLSVFPLLASLMGTRWALLYLGESLALGLGTMALGLHGYTLPQVDSHPALTAAMDFCFVTIMVSLGGLGVYELRRRTMEAVAAASRAKSAFLANMSHEIRTPMNGVLGLTEVMLTEPLPPHQRERLELIHRSGDLLVALINDLLDLSRIEAGKMPIAPVPTELERLASDVHQLFKAAANERHLELLLELDPELPAAVLVDPLRLKQILTNLVSNAVKFTDRGAVRLAVGSRPGDRVRFEVRDSGLGMSPEQLGRLFHAFQQLKHGTNHRGGSGLGLALSKHLVELLGGEISVESRLGEGSSFSFELVLPKASLPVRLAETPPKPRPGGRVLVVDDNAINLKVARSLAEKAGYRVTTAVNGLEAVAAVERDAFDVVLMDCHMPELDGFEATRRIRRLPGARAKVRILALTASALPEDVAACLASGMDGVLAKPISMARLLEALTSPKEGSAPRALVGT
jgi:signal transduction histidine kinase/CheY-like chemotaxis protein